MKAFSSRVQRGDETKAHSFPGPVVFMFEASQHSVPYILQQNKNQINYSHNNHILRLTALVIFVKLQFKSSH